MKFYDLDKKRAFLVSLKALIIQEGKLLIIKNTAEVWGRKSQWELPGGLIEADEDIQSVLVREVKEETGLGITVGEIFAIWDHWERGFKLKDGRILDIRVVEVAFLSRKTGGKIKLSEEHRQFKWVDKSELKKFDFAPNSKGAIEEYLKKTNPS